MQQPIIFDGFSGAGGSAYGYKLAGFAVVGCDIAPQPHYAGDAFYQDDCLSALDTLLAGHAWHGYHLDDFAALHASPVCKGYTELNFEGKEDYPLLIPNVRERLMRTGLPYVIENVEGASNALPGSLLLCGSMFDLKVWRHRLFESNVLLFGPGRKCQHGKGCIGVYGHSIWDTTQKGTRRADGRIRPKTVSFEVGCAAMGITWMNRDEMSQAIPPIFTQHIGMQLMDMVLRAREEVA